MSIVRKKPMAPHVAIFVLAISFVTTTYAVAAAPLTRAELNQYEQIGKRFGLTAQQVAQVYDFIDRNSAVISAAAAREKVNQAAFKAIARELGLRNFGADTKLVLDSIKANAAQAAKFENDNRELRLRISSLENAALRAPAEAILARADAAYAAGDLETAQRELNSLLNLRGGELAGSIEAYESAIDTARALARSRGDIDQIDRIASQTKSVLVRLRKRAQLIDWRNETERADFRYERGKRLGKIADLEEASSIFITMVLPLVPKSDYPQEWAASQVNIGVVLSAQGESLSGNTGSRLLAQSVEAFEAALTVYSKADTPAVWAQTQTNLGVTRFTQGQRLNGDEGARLVSLAIDAFDAALTVYDKASAPSNWAAIQSNRGGALTVLGERSDEESSKHLLGEAVKAFTEVLTIYNKTDAPDKWANTQNNLGTALIRQGERLKDETGTRMFSMAVAAFEAALSVTSKAVAPSDWASMQTNLGSAFSRLGERSQGDAATRLFGQSVAAFKAALTVRSKADTATAWAETQGNLGLALTSKSEGMVGLEAIQLLEQAVAAFEAALSVYSAADDPVGWARTQANLGISLVYLGGHSSDEAASRWMRQSVEAFERALTIYGPAYLPEKAQSLTQMVTVIKAELAKRQALAE